MTHATDILKDTAHRYYPLPKKHWLLYQEWHQVLLLHWSVEAELLNKLIPEGLKLDLFNGRAYLSIVGFNVENFRSFFMKIPFIGHFKEINLRTYVTCNGIKGVYFFSLYADKLLAVLGATLFYQLPYKPASVIRNDEIFITSGKGLRLQLDYEVGNSISNKSTLDTWLTERHAFFQQVKNNLYQCDIHHKEWPLHKIEFRHELLRLTASSNILLPVIQTFEIAHFAPFLEVLFWNRIKVSG